MGSDFHGGAPLVKQETLVTADCEEDAYFSYGIYVYRGGRGSRTECGGRVGHGGFRGAGRGRLNKQNHVHRETGLTSCCHICHWTKPFSPVRPHRCESQEESADRSGTHEEAHT